MFPLVTRIAYFITSILHPVVQITNITYFTLPKLEFIKESLVDDVKTSGKVEEKGDRNENLVR